MSARRAALLVAAALLAPGCRKTPVGADAREALDLLPLASDSDPAIDQNIVLTPAPMPKPCAASERSVSLCAEPTPLQISRSRYRALKSLWGERRGPPTRIEKIIQAGAGEWRVVLYGGQERPLAWLDPHDDGALVLWPVRPGVSQIQAPLARARAPQAAPAGPTTLRVQFERAGFPPLSTYELRWTSPQVLSLRLRRPRAPFRILLDPGHGGEDAGANVLGVRESDVNLLAARALARALEERGIAAVLTRAADETVSLDKRFQAVQGGRYDLALSLHHDSVSPEGSADRPACFYGREDLFALAKGLCAILRRTARGAPVPSRRHLVLTQATATPALLLELLDMNEGLVRDKPAYAAFLKSWAAETAKSLSERLQDARSRRP